ncbi:carboxypeptidase Q-like [Condylostylus longicornis]|uniref:carboxypeptidase Q-like n=1 Tax=Condylostylus longicornis TaxID=2530218 RepID=UPI00244DDD01|nr:carboxypeptidase Q-like [Condylostylus longicornis]XP_055371979.1 carboxypeptidase Q-like [Condylostylus longicornis]XP_055372051.1 carboxypeptidase Q-like [Condylostylus longicornis]XP_055372132.1 carboxypeptidase Q-like [Condylostylus longicornis]XP_055372215.1 carboxypeptidase Q-like [Condylostylus longicornis]XP_055372289.1 carboxypeptidase Q-like [Condylostylus longicornis]XP_055372377.1 carboxypeptidase Q-like [Condylostylus longicornis]
MINMFYTIRMGCRLILIFLGIISIKVTHGGIFDNRVDTPNFQNNLKDEIDYDQCNLPINLKDEIAGYQNVVNEIIHEIVNGKFSGDTYKSLRNMTDICGSRLAGSENLETAIDYMIKEFENNNLENVHTENAPVTHWVRGFEMAQMVYPRKANLPVLGLGRSIATPSQGIIADVIAVESFEELRSLPDDEVKGKIVVYAQKWKSYGETVQYRSRGAIEASKKGAVAALVKTIAPFSIGSPHTGSQNYQSGVKPIPVGCITIEDANMILRLSRISKIQIHLVMHDKNLPDAISRNLIGEFVGKNNLSNKSVVVLSGHIDSWDVGVGAMDDGGGAFISWKSLEYLKKLGLRPKRTLRAILWTGEEFGYLGASQYHKDHKETEEEEFNFMMESDSGTFTPLGLGFSGNNEAKCILKEILKLMKNLNATRLYNGADTPDLGFWLNRGFPGASLKNANEKYFWFHHSAGDTMEVLNSDDLDKATALFSATAFVIADLSIDIPRTLV